MSVHKKRFSVTLTTPFLERLDRLVKEGINIDPQAAIREALKRYFEYHGMPITVEEVEAS